MIKAKGLIHGITRASCDMSLGFGLLTIVICDFLFTKSGLIVNVLSPSPSPYFALCAHVMPPWKPNSRHTTLTSLMFTSSSQTVPHVLSCSTSKRPSCASRAKLPAKRTLTAGARVALRWEDVVRRGSARAGQERNSSSRTRELKQRVRVIVTVSRESAGKCWNSRMQFDLFLAN